MAFWKCVNYLVLTGIISFFVGRIIPKRWFSADVFPYRSFAFEQDGKFYDRFKIRFWQKKVPDMSKILPKLMPAKCISYDYKEQLPRMLQETCVAEFIHTLLCFSGLYCLKLWPGMGGAVVSVIYILVFNLPYIMIQRYNRPRLMRLNNRIKQQTISVSEGSIKQVCEC